MCVHLPTHREKRLLCVGWSSDVSESMKLEQRLLLSCVCSNKSPPTTWLKMVEIYRLTVPVTRRPRIKVWTDHLPSEGSREESVLSQV